MVTFVGRSPPDITLCPHVLVCFCFDLSDRTRAVCVWTCQSFSLIQRNQWSCEMSVGMGAIGDIQDP